MVSTRMPRLSQLSVSPSGSEDYPGGRLEGLGISGTKRLRCEVKLMPPGILNSAFYRFLPLLSDFPAR